MIVGGMIYLRDQAGGKESEEESRKSFTRIYGDSAEKKILATQWPQGRKDDLEGASGHAAKLESGNQSCSVIDGALTLHSKKSGDLSGERRRSDDAWDVIEGLVRAAGEEPEPISGRTIFAERMRAAIRELVRKAGRIRRGEWVRRSPDGQTPRSNSHAVCPPS